MSHPIDAYDHYGHSHQDKPTTQRLDSNSSSHSSQQPATPRMLRNVSGSLKNSKTDITSIDEGNANHEFGQLLQLHLQHHQQQQQQQQQHQQHQQQHQQHAKQVSLTPQSHIPHSHSRTPSINRVPSYGPVKKKPELLPPAAISSPKPQTQDMPPPASHSSAQSNSHPHPVTPGQPSSNRPNPVTPGQTSSHGPNAGPTSHGQTQPAQTLTQTPTQTPTPTPTPAQAQANAQQFHRKSIGDWDFIKTIGAGSMGKVKLARHNTTGEVCAVKIVPRAAKLFQRAHANDPPVLNPQQAAQRQKDFEKEVARDKRTIREAALGRLLFHPFICRLYEMVPMTNHYYMLFEYVEGGQMLDYIVSHGSLKEKNARKFVRGIASALDYCHKNSVVHRDLKIENIMINQKGDIKIIDFGLSNLYSPTTLLKTYCGSLYFAAPELLSARPYTGPEVDVWSFGVVLYVLVCGKVPFDDKSVSVLHEKIKRGNVEYPEFLSKECVSLLSRMLVVDPLKRATLYEIMQHPWMNRGYDHPPSSYVPKRVPLSLPLDPNIVKSIASFDLGTEAAINQELTNILSSVEYQMSCENWYKISKQGREYNSASNSHLLSDPTAGFHPLISIYYLIDEMKKRKKAKEQAIELQRQQQLQQKQLDLQLNQGSLESLQFAQELQSNTHQQIQQQAQRNTLDTLPATPQVVSTPQVPPAPISEPSHLPELVTAPPPIAFPEAAHTSPTTHSSYKQSAMENPVIPEQQPSSPRPSVSIPETLDPNNGKPANGGFNSILRRLSTKSKHRSSASTSTASKNSGNSISQQMHHLSLYLVSMMEKVLLLKRHIKMTQWFAVVSV